MFLGDFHVHSVFSDGKLTIPELVDLYGKHGFGALAITDHFCEEKTVLGKAAVYLDKTLTRKTLPEYLQILEEEKERAWKQYKMVLFSGFEYTKNSLSNHRSAHIVGVGVERFISPDESVEKITSAIRQEGGISIAAHPVWTRKTEAQTYYLWDRREALRPCFDAWEIASGPYLFEEVAKTSLPKIANSDMHHLRQFCSWKTVLDCERHPEAILKSICCQKIRFRYFREYQPNILKSFEKYTSGPSRRLPVELLPQAVAA